MIIKKLYKKVYNDFYIINNIIISFQKLFKTLLQYFFVYNVFFCYHSIVLRSLIPPTSLTFTSTLLE